MLWVLQTLVETVQSVQWFCLAKHLKPTLDQIQYLGCTKWIRLNKPKQCISDISALILRPYCLSLVQMAYSRSIWYNICNIRDKSSELVINTAVDNFFSKLVCGRPLFLESLRLRSISPALCNEISQRFGAIHYLLDVVPPPLLAAGFVFFTRSCPILRS